MRRSALAAAGVLLLAGCHGESADDASGAPSALVTVQAPRRSTVPDVVEAYGSAAPALNATSTLSVQQPGQVVEIDVTPGGAVRAGQPLVRFVAAPSATAAYDQAVSTLDAAQVQRAHAADLLAQQLGTRDQLAAADKAVADARSSLAAMEREGAGRGETTLTAPFDGVITAIPVAQGDRVQPGATLVAVGRTQGILVTVGVDPALRARLKPGEAAAIERLGGGPALTGRVVRVDDALNPKTRMIDVDVSVAGGSVLNGESFKVGITAGTVTGWTAPRDTMLTDDQGPYVFQVAGGKAVRVAVRPLARHGDTDVFEGPLVPDRPLVTQGNYQLANDMAVRTQGGQAR